MRKNRKEPELMYPKNPGKRKECTIRKASCRRRTGYVSCVRFSRTTYGSSTDYINTMCFSVRTARCRKRTACSSISA